MTNQIKLIRLISGEELIAEIVPSGEAKESLKNPVMIIRIPSRVETAGPQFGLAPWLQFSKDEIVQVHPGHIITMAEPIADLVDQYNQIHSKIVQPKKSGLIIP